MIHPHAKTTVKMSKVAQVEKALAEARKSFVKVGVQEGAGNYSASDGGQPVWKVASWIEMGTTPMPARPFIRPAIESHMPTYKAMIAKAVEDMKALRANAAMGLARVGFRAVKDIQNMLLSNVGPPLTQAYLKDRLRHYKNAGTRTLVRSGLLLRSIQFRLVFNGQQLESGATHEQGDAPTDAGLSGHHRDAQEFKARQRSQRAAAAANPKSAAKAFGKQHWAFRRAAKTDKG